MLQGKQIVDKGKKILFAEIFQLINKFKMIGLKYHYLQAKI